MAFIIGVAGGSGSGKTTVARALAAALPQDCASIEYDAYYRDLSHLPHEDRSQVNFDHPDALETELLAEHLCQLQRGLPVETPIYDFVTHSRRSETLPLAPTPVVIVEGIMTLVHADIRARLDVKLFVDTDADLRVMRRIRRDIEHRGRDFESIRRQYYSNVRPMHLEFVEPSKRYADLIIPEGGDNRVAIDMIIARIKEVVNSRAA